MKATLVNEEWRPVVGYEGIYDASNFGRVKGLDRRVTSNTNEHFQKGVILKLKKTKSGYLQIGLHKLSKQREFYVHRLVWEAFNGPIPEGMEVNHINEIKTDNSFWNLNLMTPKENINWGNRNKKCSEKMVNGKTSDPVLQLTLDDELVKEWPSIMEAGRHGFTIGSISMCCNGKLKTHKGFKWRKKC